MTPQEFWNAFYRQENGLLTEAEEQKYKLVGLYAEHRARENGSSLLPYVWQNPVVPVNMLEKDLLIAIGMVQLVMQGVGAS